MAVFEAVTTAPPAPPMTRTLAPHAAAWACRWLVQPDGPNAGDPWRWTGEQLAFLALFYAIDDHGRPVYRRATLRRSKGWGKDPLAAALAWCEFVGPCRFGGFVDPDDARTAVERATGIVAVPEATPWVQLAAVSERQTVNTMSLVLAMASDELVDAYALDMGRSPAAERIFTPDGGRLERVTSSARSIEGARPTHVQLNETQEWVRNNNGTELAAAIRRNLGKSRNGAARSVELCNAFEPGRESVAEASHTAWTHVEAGTSVATGVLYDAREGPSLTDAEMANRDTLRDALEVTYGDAAEWVDLDRILDEIMDPVTPVSVSRRYYLNQITETEDAWTTAAEWDSCRAPVELAPGDRVALGFDGSKSDDATALVAVRCADMAAFVLGLWEPPDASDPRAATWEVDARAVDDTVSHAFATLDVAAFFADPALWQSFVKLAWVDRYRQQLRVTASSNEPISFPTGNSAAWTRAAEQLHAAITERGFVHDGDPRLRRHALNARRAPNRWGISFDKEHRESARKVDALDACVLAYEAARRVRTAPGRKRRRGSVKLIGV